MVEDNKTNSCPEWLRTNWLGSRLLVSSGDSAVGKDDHLDVTKWHWSTASWEGKSCQLSHMSHPFRLEDGVSRDERPSSIIYKTMWTIWCTKVCDAI